MLKLEFKWHAKLHKFENFTHLFLKLIYLFLLNVIIRNKDCMWLILVACFVSPYEYMCVKFHIKRRHDLAQTGALPLSYTLSLIFMFCVFYTRSG